MKEQELLFTDVCTLKHSYVPKSSLLAVFSPVSRNARSLSAAHGHGRRRISTHVLYSYVRTHTHSTIYVFHSNKRGNALESTDYYYSPLATGGESIYVKQLSTQSSQSEIYSNKDVINGAIPLFQSNVWIWMNSDWRGTRTKPCGSVVIKHYAA